MDYLGRLLLAIERARPWNGFAILMPEGMEYAISPMPVWRTSFRAPGTYLPTYRW